MSYKSKNLILTKGIGILIFTGILLVCTLAAETGTFRQGFLLTFGLMVWIGLYDTGFLDWVLFANLPMFRLEGTEHRSLSPEVVSCERDAVSRHHLRADSCGAGGMARHDDTVTGDCFKQ